MSWLADLRRERDALYVDRKRRGRAGDTAGRHRVEERIADLTALINGLAPPGQQPASPARKKAPADKPKKNKTKPIPTATRCHRCGMRQIGKGRRTLCDLCAVERTKCQSCGAQATLRRGLCPSCAPPERRSIYAVPSAPPGSGKRR
jgi:hypothetical protein